MPNVRLRKKTDLSSFRKIALGTWRTAKDPQVYGSLTVRMDDTLRYLERYRQATGKRVTVTHLLAKVAGRVLHEVKDANAVLRFGRIYLRDDIAVFFQVVMKDEETGEIDLSGVKVKDPHVKTLVQIHDEFVKAAEAVRTRKDKELEQTRSTFKSLPWFLAGAFLNFLTFLLFTLNLRMKWAGLPQDPFGSMMVTNIGSIGLEQAFVPVVPYSRVPLLVAVGAVKKAALVNDDGTIEVGQTMQLCVTFDHRVLDGAHAANMSRVVRECFEDPETHFGPIDEAVAAVAEPAPASA
jgi:pyruvate/2-oxoglutarate dehydrogenase complex dihydrolipoamide acyltransferase (E2) component